MDYLVVPSIGQTMSGAVPVNAAGKNKKFQSLRRHSGQFSSLPHVRPYLVLSATRVILVCFPQTSGTTLCEIRLQIRSIRVISIFVQARDTQTTAHNASCKPKKFKRQPTRSLFESLTRCSWHGVSLSLARKQSRLWPWLFLNGVTIRHPYSNLLANSPKAHSNWHSGRVTSLPTALLQVATGTRKGHKQKAFFVMKALRACRK